jgi:hypothetical protein
MDDDSIADHLSILDDLTADEVDEVDDEVVGNILIYFNNYICIFSENVYTIINVRFLLTDK